MNRLCPVCDKPLEKQDFHLYACRDDMLFFDSRYSGGMYGDDYLLHQKLRERTQLSDHILRARWSFIGKHIPLLQDKSLLDYGCGSGAFVRFESYDVGCVFTYDPFFKPDHSFLLVEVDILTLWDVIEHIIKLEIIPLILAEHIFLTLPIIDRVKDLRLWKHYRPYEHVWYFSSRALIRLFEGWGYRLVERHDFEAELRSRDIASFYFRRA